MRLLALEKEIPDADKSTMQSLLKDEARNVWELQQSRALREIYFNSEKHTDVLLLEFPDVQEARLALAAFPLVAAGMITFDIIPLAPYDGFARLFA